MKKCVPAALVMVVLLTACRHTADKTGLSSNTQNTDSLTTAHTYEPVKRIMDCIHWRYVNDAYLNNLWCRLTIPNGCDTTTSERLNNTTRFYSINYQVADSFLTALKRSNYFSDTFITRLSDYIYQVDDKWKITPEAVVYQSKPEEFDHDFMMLSQPFEWDTAAMAKTEIIANQQALGHAEVVLRFSWAGNDVLTYYLTKTDSTWQIENILPATD